MYDDIGYVDNTVIGDPLDQAGYWELQNQGDNCAVVAELSIMHQFGVDITQDDANYISAENGWYHPGGGGTSPDDIGNMMDLYNIPNHTVHGAQISDLAYELQQGHGVIVGVNSADLWEQGPLEAIANAFQDDLGIVPANHAVTVTGIVGADTDQPMVVLNDSGHPGGQGVMYPLDQFMDAWENSDFYYTATDQAIPSNDVEAIQGIDFSRWIGAVAGLSAGIDTFLDTGDMGTAMAVGQGVAAFTGGFIEGFFDDADAIRMI